jgi:hypothetical protein
MTFQTLYTLTAFNEERREIHHSSSVQWLIEKSKSLVTHGWDAVEISDDYGVVVYNETRGYIVDSRAA